MPALHHDRLDIDGSTRFDGLAGDPFAILMRAEHATADEVLAVVVASLNAHRPAFHEHAACRGSTVDFSSKRVGEDPKKPQVTA